jgi:hypothetical protein
MRCTNLVAMAGVMLSMAAWQTSWGQETVPASPVFAPRQAPPAYATPTPNAMDDGPYHPPGSYAANQPAFRWGWFGAERFKQHPQWHYDYQRSAMRWKYYR